MRSRTPAGAPTGGQFAASTRSESAVVLAESRARQHDPMAAPAVAPWDSTDVVARSEHPDTDVRATLAQQMSLMARDRDQARLMHMLRDNGWEPAFGRSNKRFVETSHRLAADPDPNVRRLLATSATYADDKTPQMLAADPAPIVRAALAANAKRSGLDAKTIKRLAKDPDHEVRVALVSSGADIPVRYRRRLANDPHPGVQATYRDRMGA